MRPAGTRSLVHGGTPGPPLSRGWIGGSSPLLFSPGQGCRLNTETGDRRVGRERASTPIGPFTSIHSPSFFFRNNALGAAGWAAVADALEGVTCLTSLNGCDKCRAIREGGLHELNLYGTELGVWAARYLPRSASTLTELDLRCLHPPPTPPHPTLRTHPPRLSLVWPGRDPAML